MNDMRVRCVAGRMIGDGVYLPGEEYTLPAAQAAKYAAGGYFVVLGPVPAPASASDGPEAIGGDTPEQKLAPAPENKVLRGEATKRDKVGWPNRQGVTVHLDGTPVK